MPPSQPLPPLPPLPAGVKRVTKRKPDGTVAVYYYLRSNGARVPPPDSPGFAKAKAQAESLTTKATATGLGALIDAYRRSPEFLGLRPVTKRSKEWSLVWLRRFEDSDPRDIKRSHVLDLRDIVARESGPGTAMNVVSCLSTIYSWAINRGKLELNPAFGIKKLPLGAIPPWTEEEVQKALTDLPQPLQRAMNLALNTGQRRADLARMQWDQYDGQAIRLVQQKTGRSLRVPLTDGFRAEIEEWRRTSTSPFILVKHDGAPWNVEVMSAAFWTHLPKIGIYGRSLHGLRKLATVRLAEAGCSMLEIAAISGHASLSMVAHYTRGADQQKLAEAAISKLETARGNHRKKTP
jgi:integrase